MFLKRGVNAEHGGRIVDAKASVKTQKINRSMMAH